MKVAIAELSHEEMARIYGGVGGNNEGPIVDPNPDNGNPESVPYDLYEDFGIRWELPTKK